MHIILYEGWKDRTPIRAFSLPSVSVHSVSVSVSVSVSDGSLSCCLCVRASVRVPGWPLFLFVNILCYVDVMLRIYSTSYSLPHLTLTYET